MKEDHDKPSEEVDSIHHPDFAAPTTPFDVLFMTRYGTLFWFSLPLLTCYSPYFAAIDWDTLRRPDDLRVRSGCIALPTTPSNGFALILHTLLLDYTQRRLDNTLTTSYELPFPDHVLGDNLIDSLNEALEIAEIFRIDSFVDLIGHHILIHAHTIMSTRPFDSFALALVGGSYDIMRNSIDYFPKDVNAPIPPAVDFLIKRIELRRPQGALVFASSKVEASGYQSILTLL